MEGRRHRPQFQDGAPTAQLLLWSAYTPKIQLYDYCKQNMLQSCISNMLPLVCTFPSHSEWQDLPCNCCGRAAWQPDQVREYLEKNWKETSGKETVALTVRALMEVVEAGSKNLDIALMEQGTGARCTPLLG